MPPAQAECVDRGLSAIVPGRQKSRSAPPVLTGGGTTVCDSKAIELHVLARIQLNWVWNTAFSYVPLEVISRLSCLFTDECADVEQERAWNEVLGWCLWWRLGSSLPEKGRQVGFLFSWKRSWLHLVPDFQGAEGALECFASEIELWNILHSPLSPFDLVKAVMVELS